MVYVQITEMPTDIWRLPGRKSRFVGRPPEKLITSSANEWNPAYSPDGRKIAFFSDRSGVGNIWVCDADGSNPVQLTRFDSQTGSPRWSPDGRQIVFDSMDGGDWNLYLVDAEGGVPRRLTPEPSADFRGTFSRDGRWVYFSSDRGGSNQIWKLPSGGGPAVQVTRGGGTYAMVSGDDRYLYYVNRDSYEDRGTGVSIRRVPVEGGGETEVLSVPIPYYADWALSQEGIYYAQAEPSAQGDEETYVVRFLDLASGRKSEIFRKTGPFSHIWFAVSPGEEWILYGEAPRGPSELMLVENFR
jgi:Tol biopolymer transport system component